MRPKQGRQAHYPSGKHVLSDRLLAPAPTYTVWILTTDDAAAAVDRWYDGALRRRGWRRVPTASRPRWIGHQSYARGPHATFTVALLDGRSMRRFWGDRLGRGRTVVEVRYRQ